MFLLGGGLHCLDWVHLLSAAILWPQMGGKSPVAERAVQVWPVIMKYVDAVKQKKLPNPGTASYDTIEAAQADPFIIAKLQFFLAISRTFNPFLTKYQTDEPVLPFLVKDLSELLKKSLLRRF
ncbi:hypothetical protein G5714_004414 [Onychostoma macrolepis]|uniref:Uncharacterized protein n=1 Tax=Onychostoma macrolepis TaxID=369639 RepID=A0A7J6D4N7_9TELE|nr:hypothetical protein G5714_004414 [Onychostoma macrolepis]